MPTRVNSSQTLAGNGQPCSPHTTQGFWNLTRSALTLHWFLKRMRGLRIQAMKVRQNTCPLAN